MSIRILFFATIADVTGRREMELEAPAAADVASIYARLAQEFPGLESAAPPSCAPSISSLPARIPRFATAMRSRSFLR